MAGEGKATPSRASYLKGCLLRFKLLESESFETSDGVFSASKKIYKHWREIWNLKRSALSELEMEALP
jgi:hypothetical protein